MKFRFVVIRDVHAPGPDVNNLHRGDDVVTDLMELPRRAEALGYACMGISDHLFSTADPLIDTMACLSATTSLRVTQTVLVNDYRHPALVARAIASIDVLSNGRAEVGLGAGFTPADFSSIGLPYDEAKVRVRRLREALIIIRSLLTSAEPLSFKGEFYEIDGLVSMPRPVQQPGPPIWVAGGGPVVLRLAGELADVIDIAPQNVHPSVPLPMDPRQLSMESFRKKVDNIKQGAGVRFDEIRTGLPVMKLRICEDPLESARAVRDEFEAIYQGLMGREDGFDVSPEELVESPWFWIGTEDELVRKAHALRDEYGLSQFIVMPGAMDEFQPLLERLNGN